MRDDQTKPRTRPATQAALATAASAGDQNAYDRLFTCAAERVLLFIRLRLGPGLRARLEPTDVLQDTYLAALRKLPELEWRGDRAFVNWLCGIADRRIRQLREHHGAQKRAPAGHAIPLSGALERVNASGHGVLTSVARRESREHLESSFDDLDDDVREALTLRFFGGVGIPEIATRMGRSESATRRLIGAGLRQVGTALPGTSSGAES